MKVTKVTRTYYVVNGEKVYFFEPIKVSKKALQKLLNQSEKLVKSIHCGGCYNYIQCKKDVRAATAACKDYVQPKKTMAEIIKEMDKEMLRKK